LDSTNLRTASDDELLTLAQQRDEAAFAELMRRNTSSSFKLAFSILKDRQDAEDEVQNSFWNAWRSVGQFHGDSKFSTWVSRIVINQCLMRLRKARRMSFLYLDDAPAGADVGGMELRDHESTPEQKLDRKQTEEILRREIGRLPPIFRAILVLRDLNELSIAEAAAQLGISMVAAKSRLLRARLELRQRLEKSMLTLRPTGGHS
jgi:RNA polymerase sigma-70 factor (ECF subfamily)